MPRVPEGYRLEPGTGALVRVVARRASVLQFMARLSEEEQLALIAIRIDPNTPLDVRAALELLKETRDNTTDKHIAFDDPRTVRGASIALAVLSDLPADTPGRIDPATVSARLAAWLADFPQPGEAVL